MRTEDSQGLNGQINSKNRIMKADRKKMGWFILV